MHIPSLAASGTPCIVTSIIAGIGISVAVYKASQASCKPSFVKFAAVSSLICMGQMFDLPFHGIVPAHLIGGVLAVSLLGIPFGVLSLVFVLSAQCLLFRDGTMSALGANVIQMAFMAAGFGGLIKTCLSKHNLKELGKYVILGLSAWASVVSASIFCALTLFWDHSTMLSQNLIEIFGIHLLIGTGEAFATIAVVYLFAVALRPASSQQQAVALFTL